MNDIVNKSRGTLREAANDFMNAAKQTSARLAKERDRLAADITRANQRIKRMEADLEARSKRIVESSRSAASKASTQYKATIAKLKRGLTDARMEARNMRAEFKIVSKDLRDAGQHLSHALHIDKAVNSIDSKLKTARARSRGRAMAKRSSKAPNAVVKK